MNLITAEHLTHSFTERKLFDDVSFSLNEDEKVGIIGINGTGKSTLLKILAKEEIPDQGTITTGGIYGSPICHKILHSKRRNHIALPPFQGKKILPLLREIMKLMPKAI